MNAVYINMEACSTDRFSVVPLKPRRKLKVKDSQYSSAKLYSANSTNQYVYAAYEKSYNTEHNVEYSL